MVTHGAAHDIEHVRPAISRQSAVFLLELDRDTLRRRIAALVDEWGRDPAERAIMLALHASRKYQPETGSRIDATRPLADDVDTILAHSN